MKKLMKTGICLVVLGVMAWHPFVYSQEEGSGSEQSEMRGGQGQRQFGGQKGHHGPRGPERMLEELNLTEEQKDQIKSLQETFRSEMQGKRSEMKSYHEQMESLMTGDASKDEILTLFEKMENQRMSFHRKRFEHILSIREILTPEQRKNFKFGPGKHGKGQRGPKGSRGPQGGPQDGGEDF